jgi:hypothetical protein
MPSRLFYINKGPGRVSQTIELKQDGKCRCCGMKFSPDEQIVSNGKRKKYYHIQCAQRLNILPISLVEVTMQESDSVFNSQDPRPTLLISPNTIK